MLLAEVEPRSSTHNTSSEFKSRETSAMPLDRRDSFCEAAGLDLCSEDPRKNFIPFSTTTAVCFWVARRFSAAILHQRL
jgi:hypothetical protein